MRTPLISATFPQKVFQENVSSQCGRSLAMTLFKRTEGTLDDLDKVLASLEADAGADVVDRKRRLDEMTEMAGTLAQNCSKLRKAAEESDPAKRTYGDSMSKKVLELCDRFDALHPKITTVTEAVSAAYAEHEKNMAAQREKEAVASAAAAKAAQEAAAAKAAVAEREAASRATSAPSAAAPVPDDNAAKAAAAASAAAAAATAAATTAAAAAAKEEERKKEAAKASHQAAAPASPSSTPSASTPKEVHTHTYTRTQGTREQPSQDCASVCVQGHEIAVWCSREHDPAMLVLPGAQSSEACAPRSTIKPYSCSREHNPAMLVLPGAQSSNACAPRGTLTPYVCSREHNPARLVLPGAQSSRVCNKMKP